MCSLELFCFFFLIQMLQGGMRPPPLPPLEIMFKETIRKFHDWLPTDFK